MMIGSSPAGAGAQLLEVDASLISRCKPVMVFFLVRWMNFNSMSMLDQVIFEVFGLKAFIALPVSSAPACRLVDFAVAAWFCKAACCKLDFVAAFLLAFFSFSASGSIFSTFISDSSCPTGPNATGQAVLFGVVDVLKAPHTSFSEPLPPTEEFSELLAPVACPGELLIAASDCKENFGQFGVLRSAIQGPTPVPFRE